MDPKTRIRQFVEQNYYTASGLADDTSLLDRGIIDSTGVLEIIVFIEGEFGIKVLDHEVLPENLDSISNIAGYVERKLAGA